MPVNFNTGIFADMKFGNPHRDEILAARGARTPKKSQRQVRGAFYGRSNEREHAYQIAHDEVVGDHPESMAARWLSDELHQAQPMPQTPAGKKRLLRAAERVIEYGDAEGEYGRYEFGDGSPVIVYRRTGEDTLDREGFCLGANAHQVAGQEPCNQVPVMFDCSESYGSEPPASAAPGTPLPDYDLPGSYQAFQERYDTDCPVLDDDVMSAVSKTNIVGVDPEGQAGPPRISVGRASRQGDAQDQEKPARASESEDAALGGPAPPAAAAPTDSPSKRLRVKPGPQPVAAAPPAPVKGGRGKPPGPRRKQPRWIDYRGATNRFYL